MVSTYGLYLHQLRYGGANKQYFQEIEQTQWLSNDELLALQFNKLKALLEHAYDHTLFYQQRFDSVGFHPNDMKSRNDLLQIPPLTREDILDNIDSMVASNYERSQLRQHFTSGTTGTPLRFYETKDAQRYTYAFWRRFRKWFGFQEWVPRATFSGRVIVPRDQHQPPFWRYNKIENQLVFSSFHISSDTVANYVKQLEEFSPFLIDGYVSSIYTLAKYINQMGIHSIQPSAIQTTSETLLESQRKEIESAFRCKVYDQYSHGEKAVFISECEYSRLHINDEYGVVEIVKDGRSAKSGELGEIVVTGFANWAMPLIRYRTGDLAVAASAVSCPCGRGLSQVVSIEGRIIDILQMPDGKVIPPTALTLLFDKASAMGIENAQIVQEARDIIIVNIVPRNSPSEVQTSILEEDLRSMMGQEIQIQFRIVDHIALTQAGKFKFVKSEIN